MDQLPVKWIPHNYQLTALSHLLSNKYAALFLDPGLGKTSVILAALKILINSGKCKGVLLIAPLRVVYSVWPQEVHKWLNFNNLTHTIIHDNNKHSLWQDVDIYITNPETLPWLHQELLTNLSNGVCCPFNTLVVDESTKFKRHEGVRYKLLVDMLPLFQRRYIMTGTPCGKSYLDLWAQIYLLDKGKALGNNYVKFRDKYFESNDWDKYNYNAKDFAMEAIKAAIAPLVLEMSATDYLDMPELIHNNIQVELSKKEYKQYKQMEREFFLELDEEQITAEAAAQVAQKCQQIANGRVYPDPPEDATDEEVKLFKRKRKAILIHSRKIEALVDLYDELNGKPLLVAYHYKHDLEAIQEAFGNIDYIGAGISTKKQLDIERRWNTGEIQILAAHPDSIAFGLNLQKSGSDICWYSLTWNLDNYIQFIARIWRQGVKGKCVKVHHLVARGTIDDAILIRNADQSKQQKDIRKAIKEHRLKLLT